MVSGLDGCVEDEPHVDHVLGNRGSLIGDRKDPPFADKAGGESDEGGISNMSSPDVVLIAPESQSYHPSPPVTSPHGSTLAHTGLALLPPSDSPFLGHTAMHATAH